MINRPFRSKSYLSPRGAGLGRLWEEFAPRTDAREGVVPACVGALPAGREGGPTRVQAGVNVCVQEEGGWCRHAGNTGLGVGMSGFSLLRGSPMTLEFNLPEPQFPQLPKWGC